MPQKTNIYIFTYYLMAHSINALIFFFFFSFFVNNDPIFTIKLTTIHLFIFFSLFLCLSPSLQATKPTNPNQILPPSQTLSWHHHHHDNYKLNQKTSNQQIKNKKIKTTSRKKTPKKVL